METHGREREVDGDDHDRKVGTRKGFSKWHFLQSIRKCFKPLRSRKVRKSEKINEKKAKKVYEKNLTKTDH